MTETHLERTLRCAPGFRIRGVLGKGGMGLVYDAVHDDTGASCALKVVRAGPRGMERFHREVRSLVEIRHPNVVDLWAWGSDDAIGWLAMERAEGTVMDRVRDGGPLPARIALRIAMSAARAARAIHAAGYVHRDLKLSNLLIFGSVVKVADFGVVRCDDSSFTKEGTRIGSRGFMAPEQALSATTVGPEADVYALGACTYAMLTGKSPVGLERLESDHPRWLRVEHGPLRRLLHACLRPSPGARPRLSSFLAGIGASVRAA
ncbi:MAG: serine/threonine-protein kinase [Myxococcota bacterium]